MLWLTKLAECIVNKPCIFHHRTWDSHRSETEEDTKTAGCKECQVAGHPVVIATE